MPTYNPGSPYKNTSGYGPRNTGIPGASTFHKGQDFGALSGTPIPDVMRITVILIFFYAFAASACASGETYVKHTKLNCGKSTVEVSSICKHNPDLGRPVCIKQEFKFNHHGKTSTITNKESAGSRVTHDADDLWYTATEWACISGKTGSYVMILYNRATDGNCKECETSNVYDLNGEEIIPKLDPNARDRENRIGVSNRRPHFMEIPRRITD